MHGLVTGEESRQQLYTMLTRGRIANHLYLQVVGDGDPHSLIRPETIHPSTATDLLEQILARDGTARSATTLQRDQHHPAARLADAAGRYVDALHVAAEDLAGREVVAALDVAAEQMVPGLIDEPAWPILRAHLLLLAAHGTDPVAQLATVAASRELSSADDRAAVLDWRLDDTGHRNAAPGTLPWLPGIPTQLGDHPMWRNYLAARSDLVRTLANQTIFGAREDISTRPAGTTDAMLSGPAVRNWVEPDLAVAALVRDRPWRSDRYVARDPARSRKLPEQTLDTGPILAHLGIDLAVSAFQPACRDKRRTAVPRASQIDRLLPGEANEPGDVDVDERESWAGAPVAKQPRLDVLDAERPLQQRVVFQVDLPDRQVITGSPPRINGGQLAIGQGSKLVPGQLQGHTTSLMRGWRRNEGRKSLATLQGRTGSDPQALPGDFPPACRPRDAPYTAACVRRCMPSLVSRPDT